MSRSFDGGSPATPRDVTRPVDEVLVVGAGMAGLAAANALAHAGVPVTVLEARSRIGGRTHTVDLAGVPVDLGASWIHTPIGNPMTALADELGVARRPWHLFDLAVGWDPAAGVIPRAEFEPMLEQAEAIYEAAPAILGALGPGVAAPAAIDHHVASLGLQPVAAGRLREILTTMVEADASGAAASVPFAHHPANGLDYDGDARGDVPDGGYRRIVDGLAAGLDIRVGSPVAAVAWGPAGVVATTADGTRFEGSHAVVTLPLGVLKAERVAFEPGLPADRRSAIARLGFGRFDKVAMRFERPFWTQRGAPHVMLAPARGRPPIAGFFGLDSAGSGPVLVAFGFGSTHGGVADGSPEDAVGRALAAVRAIVGEPVPEPVAAVRSEWWRDPFAMGAYAYVQTGSEPADLDLLGQPIGGRLLFAGEATGHARVGYADGALSTGVREAKRLLGSGSAELGRLAG